MQAYEPLQDIKYYFKNIIIKNILSKIKSIYSEKI